MFRVLIVEDQSLTASSLRELLLERIPRSRIDVAETVNCALEQVRSTLARGDLYDAVVLDFQLPRESGDSPELDESICRALQDFMPLTRVVHITAFEGDPAVVRHVQEMHENAMDPTRQMLSKGKPSWASEVVSRLSEIAVAKRQS